MKNTNIKKNEMKMQKIYCKHNGINDYGRKCKGYAILKKAYLVEDPCPDCFAEIKNLELENEKIIERR
jgi:hypothetical protein